jgi:vacuolar-type H+-ATPase subunit E/Vma4
MLDGIQRAVLVLRSLMEASLAEVRRLRLRAGPAALRVVDEAVERLTKASPDAFRAWRDAESLRTAERLVLTLQMEADDVARALEKEPTEKVRVSITICPSCGSVR